MSKKTSLIRMAGLAIGLGSAAAAASGQTFLAPNNYATPTQPVHLVAADFTGDGRIDIAVACNFAGQFAVLGQTVSGLLTLGGAKTIANGGHPLHLSVQQIDFAGPVDIVVADGTGPLQAYESDGTANAANWAPNVDLNTDYTVATGAMVSGGYSINPAANAVIGVGVGASAVGIQSRVGDGDGTYEGFNQSPLVEVGAGSTAMALGRLDSGPLADDVVVCIGSSNIVKVFMFDGFIMCSDICWRGYTYGAACPLEPGEVPPPNVPVGNNSIGVVLDHFNPAADAHLDMAVLCAGDNSVRIFRGNGNGTFVATQTINLGATVRGIASGDLNRDNRADLAVSIDPAGTGSGSIVILRNNGLGTFSSGPSLTTADAPRALVIADVSNDGRKDLAVVNELSNNLAVFRNSSVPGCIADFDSVGGVQVNDIFAFLTAWFAGYPAADINQSGGNDVPDIFDFLTLWFAGCA